MKYTKEYDIRSTEIGPDFLLKRIFIPRYFQECFSQYCTNRYVAGFDICKRGLTWIITEMEIRFALGKMPFWSENVQARVWVSEVRRACMYMDFSITYKGSVIASGDSCWYMLDIQSRHPRPVEWVASHFELEPEIVFASHKKTPIVITGKLINKQIHKVSFLDLDFNYHVNNLSYIDLAFDAVPSDFLEENILSSYRVRYARESLLNDELICKIYRNDKSLWHEVIRKDNGKEVCVVESKWAPHEKTDPNAKIEIPPGICGR